MVCMTHKLETAGVCRYIKCQPFILMTRLCVVFVCVCVCEFDTFRDTQCHSGMWNLSYCYYLTYCSIMCGAHRSKASAWKMWDKLHLISIQEGRGTGWWSTLWLGIMAQSYYSWKYTKIYFRQHLRWEIGYTQPESWFIFDQYCQM